MNLNAIKNPNIIKIEHMRKVFLKPKASANYPPKAGPITQPRYQVIVYMPMAVPRVSDGTVSAINAEVVAPKADHPTLSKTWTRKISR